MNLNDAVSGAMAQPNSRLEPVQGQTKPIAAPTIAERVVALELTGAKQDEINNDERDMLNKLCHLACELREQLGLLELPGDFWDRN